MRRAMIPGLFTALLLAGCSLHTPFMEHMDVRDTPRLASEKPADVVVLPVMDDTGKDSVRQLLPDLRRALYNAVKAKCYSPLDLDYVDKEIKGGGHGVVPAIASLQGKFGEDAMLQVTVTAWSDRKFRADRRLQVSLELRLQSSASKELLFGGRIETEIRAPGHGLVGPEEVPELMREAILALARRALSKLPDRRSLF